MRAFRRAEAACPSVAEHDSGEGGRYTRSVRPVALGWFEEHPTRFAAERRERQLKGWTRRKKEALITGDFALLKNL